ncbi:MAG: hypothetical protein HY553_12520 [Elusimicrobia bacterium]|nr:hypothetical protein [Elusimicrobiota bacterium]
MKPPTSLRAASLALSLCACVAQARETCTPISELEGVPSALESVRAKLPSIERIRAAFVCFAQQDRFVVLYDRDGVAHYFAHGAPADRQAPAREQRAAGSGAEDEREEKEKPPLITSVGRRPQLEYGDDEPLPEIKDPELAAVERRFHELFRSGSCQSYWVESEKAWKQPRFPRVDRVVAPRAATRRGIARDQEVQSLYSMTTVSKCRIAAWKDELASTKMVSISTPLERIRREASTLASIAALLAQRVAALPRCQAGPEDPACPEEPVYTLEPVRSTAQAVFPHLELLAAQVAGEAESLRQSLSSAAAQQRDARARQAADDTMRLLLQ